MHNGTQKKISPWYTYYKEREGSNCFIKTKKKMKKFNSCLIALLQAMLHHQKEKNPLTKPCNNIHNKDYRNPCIFI